MSSTQAVRMILARPPRERLARASRGLRPTRGPKNAVWTSAGGHAVARVSSHQVNDLLPIATPGKRSASDSNGI